MVLDPPHYPKGGVEHPPLHPFPQIFCPEIWYRIHHAHSSPHVGECSRKKVAEIRYDVSYNLLYLTTLFGALLLLLLQRDCERRKNNKLMRFLFSVLCAAVDKLLCWTELLHPLAACSFLCWTVNANFPMFSLLVFYAHDISLFYRVHSYV